MKRAILTDRTTAAQLKISAVPSVKEIDNSIDVVEVVLANNNCHLLNENLLKFKALSFSYYNITDKRLDKLDPEFFECTANKLYNIIQLCKKKKISIVAPTIGLFNPVKLFEEEFKVYKYPRYVFVELTRNCNSCCKMCWRRSRDKKYQGYNPNYNMKFNLFKSIANNLFKHAEFVDLRGFGESTILPDFESYVDYALKYHPKLGLVTNLSVRNNKLWRKLIANHFYIDISIDGASKQTYETIRCGLKWEDIIYNIRLIVSFATTEQIERDIFFLFTIQKDNVTELPDIVKLAAKLKIKNVKISAVVPDVQYEEIFKRITREHFYKLMQNTIKTAEQFGVNLIFLNRFYFGNTVIPYQLVYQCPRPYEYMYINYNGTIGGCNQQLSSFEFGTYTENVFKTLNSPALLALRASLGKPFQNRLCEWCFKHRLNYENVG